MKKSCSYVFFTFVSPRDDGEVQGSGLAYLDFHRPIAQFPGLFKPYKGLGNMLFLIFSAK